MVILLVACTFVLLIGLGMYLDKRESQVRERAVRLNAVANPVFAQDGGEPVAEDEITEESEQK